MAEESFAAATFIETALPEKRGSMRPHQSHPRAITIGDAGWQGCSAGTRTEGRRTGLNMIRKDIGKKLSEIPMRRRRRRTH